jgi:hypothetical protein
MKWLSREPDLYIGGRRNPYLLRWYLIPRNRWFNVYLHKFMRDDDDRALHDHPWASISFVLWGGYRELYRLNGRDVERTVTAGMVLFRPAEFSHRVMLGGGTCWTLFVTGPRQREWGFHCPHGWRHWREFTSGDHGETVGRGCD